MKKNVWIIICGLCGKEEKAIMVNRHNKLQLTLPVGWGYNYDGRIYLCPECFKRVYGVTVIEGNKTQSERKNEN